MRLTRLEIAGFKSFAKKTVFEFSGGITAIVGPNGSGKSNVIDAFRWILGARDSKNARSLRADDVIFAGTETMPRMSLAQVAVTLDNSDKFFPVDYSEVTVRRKMSRDGEAQFFLNDAEVRFKDVIDFFAQSRLGAKGFSIINQGESDLFVRALPVERRAMLEEILGLRQFQIKKHDADLKLKATGVNLDKTRALVEEMLPHVRLLRRQTAKWERHADIIKELEELEIQYFSTKISELDGERARFSPRLKELEEKLFEAQTILKKQEHALHAVQEIYSSRENKNVLAEITGRRALLSQNKDSLQKELARIEARIEFGVPKTVTADISEFIDFLTNLKMNFEELLVEGDERELQAYLAQAVSEIEQLLEAGNGTKKQGAEQSELNAEKDKILKSMAKLQEELQDVLTEESKLTKGLQNFNEEFQKAFANFQASKEEVFTVEQELRGLQFEEEKISIKFQDLEIRIRESGMRLEDLRKKDIPRDLDLPLVERKILKLRGELAVIGEIDQALLQEAEATEARHTFLEKEVQDLEKASKDLQLIIRELDTRIHKQFKESLNLINRELASYFEVLFGGGKAKLNMVKNYLEQEVSSEGAENLEKEIQVEEEIIDAGIEIEVSIPRKKVHGLEMLSGGERSLVSLAVLFALVSVSPPPFIVLDEADAALDERNSRKFGELVKKFSPKTQFLLVTHNRATMESADTLYGITMRQDGTSQALSLKLE